MKLYQQNEKITVIVRKESGGSGDGAGAKEKDTDNIGGDNTASTNIFGTNSKSRKNRIIKTNATHILAVAKQTAGLGIEYAISRIGDRYGDQALQDGVSQTVDIVQDATSAVSSVAMGAVYGAWGGPIGAIIGATLGAVSSSVSIGLKYAAKKEEYNYKAFKENNAIAYQRARASISLTTGRLR